MSSRSPYLKINSADRLNPSTTTPGRFTIVSNRPLSGLTLKAIYLPVTNHIVNSTNNRIYFSVGVTPYVATLDTGYYTVATFLTAVGAQMTAISGTAFTATQNAITQAMQISAAVSFTMTFSQTTNSAAALMGFPDSNSAVGALLQTGSNIINLATNLCYNISINQATGTETLNTSNSSTSFVIPAIIGSVPSSLYYEVPLTMPQSISFQATKLLDIGIFDDQYRPLNMTQNYYLICVPDSEY